MVIGMVWVNRFQWWLECSESTDSHKKRAVHGWSWCICIRVCQALVYKYLAQKPAVTDSVFMRRFWLFLGQCWWRILDNFLGHLLILLIPMLHMYKCCSFVWLLWRRKKYFYESNLSNKLFYFLSLRKRMQFSFTPILTAHMWGGWDEGCFNRKLTVLDLVKTKSQFSNILENIVKRKCTVQIFKKWNSS